MDTINLPVPDQIVSAAPPAIGDLDNDGIPEIVLSRNIEGLICLKWNPTKLSPETGVAGTCELLWTTRLPDYDRYEGASIHDEYPGERLHLPLFFHLTPSQRSSPRHGF